MIHKIAGVSTDLNALTGLLTPLALNFQQFSSLQSISRNPYQNPPKINYLSK